MSNRTFYRKPFYRKPFQILFTFIFCAKFLFGSNVAAQESVPAATSNLTGANLPANAARLNDESVPAEVGQALEKIIAAGGSGIRQGETEVLAWTNGYKKRDTPDLIRQLTGNLQTAGWTYEVGGENQGVTVFSVSRNAPAKRAIIGFYTSSDDAFVLAWTEMLAAKTGAQKTPVNNSREDDNSNSRENDSSAKIINVGRNDNYMRIRSRK